MTRSAGIAAVVAGVGVLLTQMLVGLNDTDEYSNPWYLQAARWLGLALVAAGAITLALSLRRGGRHREWSS
jgi:uncharacterized membrane protein YbhN (UPF0104 family)